MNIFLSLHIKKGEEKRIKRIERIEMKNSVKILCYILIGLSLLFMGIGGILDMTGKDRWLGISKHHFWNDGLYLLVLVIALNLFIK